MLEIIQEDVLINIFRKAEYRCKNQHVPAKKLKTNQGEVAGGFENVAIKLIDMLDSTDDWLVIFLCF